MRGRLLIRCALMLFGLTRLLRWLRAMPSIVGLLLPRQPAADAQCLERSLIEISALARLGRSARLVIGVNKQAGRLRAHAWVERPQEHQADQIEFTRLGAL